MNEQGYNPILPSWEYIPDGEPHVFGDRVYLFGSHDRFNGHAFCLNDYVCWSAPVNDLKDWRYEGVIYHRGDDPRNEDGDQCLYAPDVCRGVDGRYYLYYVLDASAFVSVAVCDEPAGEYLFYGYVHDKNGAILGERPGDEPQFDPGVLCENGRTYLYTGFCAPNLDRHGAMVTVLGPDMLTIEEEPRFVVPGEQTSSGTGFEGHAFFEASSIRRIGNSYYFVYSSELHHALCYATSASPVEGFQYRGTIISNVDYGIGGYKPPERMMAYPDNNHGSIEQINGQWYVFYHRHTNGHSFSRQACMEPIKLLSDGSIPQVCVTSCGSNGEPLRGDGHYPAYIACHIVCEAGQPDSLGLPGQRLDPRFPYLTQDGADGDKLNGHVANMLSGATVGFKAFDCRSSAVVSVTTRGWCEGEMEVLLAWDGAAIGSIPVHKSNDWKTWQGNVQIPDGVQSLYYRYTGIGYVNFYMFEMKGGME